MPKKHNLNDMMMAMDVVDTLRHRQNLVRRELNAGERDEALLARLRQIYANQGIEVSDEVLMQGVEALKADRFAYKAGKIGWFSQKMASLYISRGVWGKWLIIGLIIIAVIFTVMAVNKPLTQAEITQIQLEQSYRLRVVARSGERSGVWRIPKVNQSAKNYYLIVEAIDNNGDLQKIYITNEEDNTQHKASKFGIRVDKSLFDKIAADKRDDGIIQNNIIGIKESGQIKADYVSGVKGGVITKW